MFDEKLDNHFQFQFSTVCVYSIFLALLSHFSFEYMHLGAIYRACFLLNLSVRCVQLIDYCVSVAARHGFACRISTCLRISMVNNKSNDVKLDYNLKYTNNIEFEN